ncbi:hypothetical protein H310_00976 [Aphanomyces invadans]|uniref:Uncharacterized protein n=1 Tax=Aphanomyces invadans TaxID=157072 RepID=A0A024URA2_9STRA|nr:hypothetical protein H310_00976 [Aphanomyces invadans]ETW08382.1 hypothetical protein H310_00976 [Aphanomyces invadans]|eukprot:XP_008862187.1 hypothetical protein H310_00976 [Aphanomyces invadans]
MDSFLALDLSEATPSAILQHANTFVGIDATGDATLDHSSELLVMGQKLMLWLLNDRAHLRQCNKRLKNELDHAVAAAGMVNVKIVKSQSPPKAAQDKSVNSDVDERAPVHPLPSIPRQVLHATTTPPIVSTQPRTDSSPRRHHMELDQSSGIGSVDLLPPSIPVVYLATSTETSCLAPFTSPDSASNPTNPAEKANSIPEGKSQPNMNTARLHLQTLVRGHLARKQFRAMLENILLADDIT